MTNTPSNYSMPQRMLDAAICAYAVEGDGSFKPEALYLDPLNLEDEPVVFDGGAHEIDAGFVATTEPDPTTNERWVILSFRGTIGSFHWDSWMSIEAFFDDWLQDDKTRKVPMSVKGETLGRVEEGFHKALHHVWPQIADALEGIEWSSVAGIQITGHSKGAAMTFLAAALVRVMYPSAKSIHVHAYAAPLAGDAQFAQWYSNQHLDVTTTRYQRVHDIVPFLPPSAAWDIFHHLPGTWHPEGIAIEAALKLASLQTHGGYQEVGQLVGLVTEDPKTSKMISRAEEYLQHAIVHAIRQGEGGKIAGAHSATDSYWPALFPQPHS